MGAGLSIRKEKQIQRLPSNLFPKGGFPQPGFPGGDFPGFLPGIHPGQIVILQASDLTHEFRHTVTGWLPPGFPGENASR